MGAPATTYEINFDDIRIAARRIGGTVHRTPVLTSTQLNDLCRSDVFLKCENLQRTGAFKFRGALNAVLSMSDGAARRGVVTHSSGNHGQALAAAALRRGVPAYIVMPDNASSVKVRAVESYKGRITFCEPTIEAREATAAALLEQTSARLVHPYNDPHVIAGQGTAAIEFLDQAPELDTLVVPVGGGGLLSGTCVSARALNPNIRLVGAEPTGADDAARSFAAGRIEPMIAPLTIADGLRTSLGSRTWPIIRDCVDDIRTVDDRDIIRAMRFVWERLKLVIEPSAAVAVAVAIAMAADDELGANTGILVSGGNVDLDNLPWQLEKRSLS